MKIRELLQMGKNKLYEKEIEDCIIKTKLLLAFYLKESKEYLCIHDNDDIEDSVKEKFLNGIEEIIQGKPIQYITHHQAFFGLDFYVDENVLIPQPDTEILVEEGIKIVQNKQIERNKTWRQGKIKILDLCTGSGVIGISLMKHLDNVEMYAADISKEALKVAKENAEYHHVAIQWIESNLFENINTFFDVIISNPPYIETDVIETLSKEVQNEPNIALDGGTDGLTFYKKIIKEAKKYLKPNGYLGLEIGYQQKEKVRKLLEENQYEQIYVKKDLASNDRVLIAKVGTLSD